MAGQESVSTLQERLASEQKLVALIDKIHTAKSLDAIFFEIQGEILSFLETERMTLYVVDQDKKELFSKFLALDTVKEIRLPISESSVAGFVAAHPQTVNIADAYNAAELQRISPKLRFDASWDKRTGFRTQQILAMPILHENKAVVGVMQMLNKKRGGRFTKEDESNVARIAKTLGVAFHTQQMLVQKRGNKFDYLLTQGLVTQEELNKAVATSRTKQVDVETVLMEQYRV
ncbi:MAG TPA: GAF domain-containing protein, partial [Methylomirabilota bacterium]|nr:GAF domain-containing protein [Methylomirabilota bacterium]